MPKIAIINEHEPCPYNELGSCTYDLLAEEEICAGYDKCLHLESLTEHDAAVWRKAIEKMEMAILGYDRMLYSHQEIRTIAAMLKEA